MTSYFFTALLLFADSANIARGASEIEMNATLLHLIESTVLKVFSNSSKQLSSSDEFNISHCLQQNSEVVFWLTYFRLDSPRWEMNQSQKNPLSCTLLLAARGNKILQVSLWRQGSLSKCSDQNYVMVRDYGYGFKTTDCEGHFRVYASSKNVLELVVVVGEPRTVFTSMISVQAVDDTFVWGLVSTSVEAVVPRDVAKPRQLSPFDGGGQKRFLWAHQDYDQATHIFTGFVLQRHRQPALVGDDLWNCSVPEWPAFQHHFRCNLDTECEGGEDEARCAFTGDCGHGYLTLAGRCYRYFRGQQTSWRDSNLKCQRHGGYLVSLNTPSEWTAVTKALKLRRYHIHVFVGLKEASSVLPVMYRGMDLWNDNTVVYFAKYLPPMGHNCGRFYFLEYGIVFTPCDTVHESADILCELDSLSEETAVKTKKGFRKTQPFHIQTLFVRNVSLAVPFVTCPAGHVTHLFLSCDHQSACWSSGPDRDDGRVWGVPVRTSCPAPLTSLPAMFECISGPQRVPYSMVCDHRRHCTDNSDESFCVFPSCSGSDSLQCFSSAQCVPASAWCNRQGDCLDNADESLCRFSDFPDRIKSPPAVVNFNPSATTRSMLITTDFQSACPETHFQCPANNGYCMPVFVRCNGINDCQGREDEEGCDSVSCPGFYRCRSSRVCLHPSHVCDGVYQCSQQDDELFCHLSCPAGCTCYGLSFACHRPFQVQLPSDVRYLDASGSGLNPTRLGEKRLLIHLSLSGCELNNLHSLIFPNLRSLDLSHNVLISLSGNHLRGMPNLRHMSLSNNPLISLFSVDTDQVSFPEMKTLDVSYVRIPEFDGRNLSLFPSLQTLNLSHCGVEHITGEGFRATTKLRVLNFAGCPMTHFPHDLLSRLNELRSVQADNFKICCAKMLPLDFNAANCQAPGDEVSSCDSLLRSDVYVFFLYMFSALAFLGNLGCFFVRTFCSKGSNSGFGAFVTHLSVSDFLMGVYLIIIGVADHLYKGSYVRQESRWTHSATCRFAGFISLLSNEVSAFIICLITLDRFLVLRFPFSTLRFKARSANVACFMVWVVVTAMAAVPLAPTLNWSFYGETGICIPLPVTRRNFAGRHYAFGVLVVHNFILFLLIAVGQVAVYISVQANTLPASDSSKKSADLRIARRLITVAVSDFLCWFPVGLLGVMASSGVPVPGEVNVGVAILVLPLNSALNPFLYTINVMLERRRKSQYEKLFRQLMARELET